MSNNNDNDNETFGAESEGFANNGSDRFKVYRDMVRGANATLKSQKTAKVKRALVIGGTVGLGISLIILIAGIITLVVGETIAGVVLLVTNVFLVPWSIVALAAGISIAIAGKELPDTTDTTDTTDTADTVVDKIDKCPKCKNKIESGSIYCNHCGTPLLKNKLCQCGKQNDIDSEYCKACGKKL